MDSKEKILLTSFRLFLSQGFKNTTMAELVNETGLSKGAFYHYFQNKEELYFSVVEKYFLSYYRQVPWETYEQQNLSVEAVEGLIKGFYKLLVPEILDITRRGMSRYFVMFFEAFQLHPTFKEEVQAFYTRLEHLIDQAILREGKQPLSGKSIISYYEGLLFLLALYPESDINQLLEIPHH